MEFSIYLDAGSRRKVTRYFHSAWWLRFVSESPVRMAGNEKFVCETEPHKLRLSMPYDAQDFSGANCVAVVSIPIIGTGAPPPPIFSIY